MPSAETLREALDRADALSATQARTIAALEAAYAVYAQRCDELRERVRELEAQLKSNPHGLSRDELEMMK